LRILLAIPDIVNSTGGIQVYNNYLIKALNECGHSLSILTINDTLTPPEANNTFISSKLRFDPVGRYGIFRKPIFVIKMFREVINFKPDLVICSHVNFAYLCMIIKSIFKIPYFVLTYGIDAFSLSNFKIKGINYSQKIITISNFTREILTKQIDRTSLSKIFLLPPPLDKDKFIRKTKPEYLMKRWNIKNSDKVIFTLARLSKTERYKGYDKIILALSRIIKASDSAGLTFKYILGGYGDDIERIKGLIKEYNLENNVILPGFIPDKEIVDYYNLCDLFVMPSKKEGFGIVFIEALSCGKPVIAGNRDASKDALLNGELGVLIDPDNVDELTDVIIRVFKRKIPEKLMDPDYLRNKVIEIYGYDKFKEQVNRLIREM
jgi:glycosyltransferase involved in cell wall biosynthesis